MYNPVPSHKSKPTLGMKSSTQQDTENPGLKTLARNFEGLGFRAAATEARVIKDGRWLEVCILLGVSEN